jgi:hypothetical protein
MSKENIMKKLAVALIAVVSVLSGCIAYDPGYRGGYGYRGDRDGVHNRGDRDRDRDGVPNRYDRRPSDPYRY